jgi:hypothetical protein
MADRLPERLPLVIRPASTGGQLPRSGAITQAGPPLLRQLVVDNSLPVVAALAAVVAVVATVVAWRAGRRARRAADLVAQLLDPPVLEPVAGDAPVATPMAEPAPVTSTPELEATPTSALAEAIPAIAVPPLPARHERHPAASGAGGNDPAQTRIPVLDLDRLRSWLTIGDVNFGRLAIVSVEIDNLGFVEERLGYGAGGHLIEAITQRLRTVTRPSTASGSCSCAARFRTVRPRRVSPSASRWASRIRR